MKSSKGFDCLSNKDVFNIILQFLSFEEISEHIFFIRNSAFKEIILKHLHHLVEKNK